MYAAYSDWVQSHRDLPIKLNQLLALMCFYILTLKYNI